MNVTLVSFSLTGNTIKVADAIAEAFRDSSCTVDTYALEEAKTIDFSRVDLLGIGSPCYASKAPPNVIDYLESLPMLMNLNAFVFVTCGGASGRVFEDLAGPIQRKGANVIGKFLALGEVHHPAPALFGRLPGRPNGEDLANARLFVKSLIEHLEHAESIPVPTEITAGLKHQFDFYKLVAAITPGSVLRRFMPEPQLDPSRCDGCLWCVQECPIGNIQMQPHPRLGDQCIRCYHCLLTCPQSAFGVDWRYGDLLVRLLYNSTFVHWFGDLQPGDTLYTQNKAKGAFHGT